MKPMSSLVFGVAILTKCAMSSFQFKFPQYTRIANGRVIEQKPDYEGAGALQHMHLRAHIRIKKGKLRVRMDELGLDYNIEAKNLVKLDIKPRQDANLTEFTIRELRMGSGNFHALKMRVTCNKGHEADQFAECYQRFLGDGLVMPNFDEVLRLKIQDIEGTRQAVELPDVQAQQEEKADFIDENPNAQDQQAPLLATQMHNVPHEDVSAVAVGPADAPTQTPRPVVDRLAQVFGQNIPAKPKRVHVSQKRKEETSSGQTDTDSSVSMSSSRDSDGMPGHNYLKNKKY